MCCILLSRQIHQAAAYKKHHLNIQEASSIHTSYRAATVDFWQARLPKWWPYHQHADAAPQHVLFLKIHARRCLTGLTSRGGPELQHTSLRYTTLTDRATQWCLDLWILAINIKAVFIWNLQRGPKCTKYLLVCLWFVFFYFLFLTEEACLAKPHYLVLAWMTNVSTSPNLYIEFSTDYYYRPLG